jgi:hypothetical protein
VISAGYLFCAIAVVVRANTDAVSIYSLAGHKRDGHTPVPLPKLTKLARSNGRDGLADPLGGD